MTCKVQQISARLAVLAVVAWGISPRTASAADPWCEDAVWVAVFGSASGPGTARVGEGMPGASFDARVVACADAAGRVPRARVLALGELSALLAEARRETAGLAEDEALRILARARTVAEAAADVPGAAAWLAEVETATGITAAQAGLLSLSRTAFSHAATLDAARRVKLAEASPDIVAVAEKIAADAATLPVGSFVVSSDVPGAEVWLDDVFVGVAPQTVSAAVGRHVLRVEARGYLAYGSVIDVLEGERPAVRVVLTADEVAALARAFRERADAMDAEGTVRAAAALVAAAGVSVTAQLVVQSGHRAAVATCDGTGCHSFVRGDAESASMTRAAAKLRVGGEDAGGGATTTKLAEARPWVDAVPEALRPVPWVKRWDMWVAAGVLVAVSTTLLVLGTTQGTPETDRRFILDVPEGIRPAP